MCASFGRSHRCFTEKSSDGAKHMACKPVEEDSIEDFNQPQCSKIAEIRIVVSTGSSILIPFSFTAPS